MNPGHFVRSTFISEAGCRLGGENVANYRFVVRSTSRRGKSARPFRFKYLQTGQFQVVRHAMSKDDELFKDDELPPQNQRNRLPAPNKVPPKSIRANNQPHSLTVDIVVFPA